MKSIIIIKCLICPENLKENEEINVGELIRRYTNDVIASAGFGIVVNSVKDKDNEFYKLGQSLFVFTVKQRMTFFIAALWPQLFKVIINLMVHSLPKVLVKNTPAM